MVSRMTKVSISSRLDIPGAMDSRVYLCGRLEVEPLGGVEMIQVVRTGRSAGIVRVRDAQDR
jgi:hypothetical protein